ncbi:nucleoporin nup211 [Drosophila eugracilis]|uniref:nucleoporin nup211 n=1 Tax=Drosophila eugracilis TaxID=29029 RepID=UPI0007E7515A|nr:nucleoporin nup211 [Drosophila eugracilis]
MKAIRCKSSSQVSSQVMIRLKLFITCLLMMTTSNRSYDIKKMLKSTDNAFKIFRDNIEKFELCVKLRRICHKIWDKPQDYPDLEEEANVEKVLTEEDKAEYRLGHCVPEGLTAQGDEMFWEVAAEWQKDIDDRFLIQNLFVIIDTANEGRNIKLSFGSWQGWCNRTHDPDETTESAEEDENESNSPSKLEPKVSPKSCDANGTYGKWISGEINGTRKLDKDIQKFSDFLQKLKKDMQKICCPYESIRNRLEIINDGIDFLQKLYGNESFTKPEYTDINSDLSSLKTRLEGFHNNLIGYNDSMLKCCPNITDELDDFKNYFMDNLKNLSMQKASFDLQPIIEKKKILQDMYLSQKKEFHLIESSLDNPSVKDTCCGNTKEQIKNINKVLEEFDNSLKEITKPIEPLKENLQDTNKTLFFVESQLNSEKEYLQIINSTYGTECLQKDSLIKDLLTKVVNLEQQINNINLINSVNWTNITQSEKLVDEMIKNKINKDKDEAIAFYELQENITKERFKQIQDQQKILTDKQNDDKAKEMENSLQLQINQLEKDIDNLTENGINLFERQLQYTHLKFEIEIETFDRKFREQQKNINLFREKMKKEQDLIEERLAKLEGKTMESPEEYDEKLSKLEAIAMEFPKQIASYEKELLDRIDALEQQIKDLDKEVENAEHRADICDAECDFGELDSVDNLIGRVQKVNDNLKLNSMSRPISRSRVGERETAVMRSAKRNPRKRYVKI